MTAPEKPANFFDHNGDPLAFVRCSFRPAELFPSHTHEPVEGWFTLSRKAYRDGSVLPKVMYNSGFIIADKVYPDFPRKDGLHGVTRETPLSTTQFCQLAFPDFKYPTKNPGEDVYVRVSPDDVTGGDWEKLSVYRLRFPELLLPGLSDRRHTRTKPKRRRSDDCPLDCRTSRALRASYLGDASAFELQLSTLLSVAEPNSVMLRHIKETREQLAKIRANLVPLNARFALEDTIRTKLDACGEAGRELLECLRGAPWMQVSQVLCDLVVESHNDNQDTAQDTAQEDEGSHGDDEGDMPDV